MDTKEFSPRFADQVEALEKRIVTTGGLLLYGSSFFAVWGYDRAHEQLAALGDIVNHGFGGSTGEEQLFYYNRLVKPYSPSAVILRGGLNDITGGISGADAASFTAELADLIHSDFPCAPVVALKCFGCPFLDGKSDEYKENIEIYNTELDCAASIRSYMKTLDITPFTSDCDNGNRLFTEDGLHLSDAGYERLSPYFISKIKELI